MTVSDHPVRLGRVLLILFGGYACIAFAYQIGLIVDTTYLHEEMRLLFRYHLESDPLLFSGDYITAFVTAFDQPHLYDWITRLWLWAGGDLIVLHRVVPLFCWLTFLAGLAVAANRLGGRITAICVLAIAVVQPVYLHQITSALPHSFAFPLLAWAFVALLYRATAGLAIVTVLCGLLYPAITPLVGLLLAWQVTISQRLLRQSKARQLGSLALLAATGGISLWLLHVALTGPGDFGAALAPMERVDVYPENGPDGRHFYGVFNPFTYVAAKAFDQFHDAFGNLKLLLLLVYTLFSLYGLLILCRAREARQAVLALVLCSMAVCTLIFLLKPYLAYRFILYPGFTIMPLLFVRGVWTFFERFEGRLRKPRLVAVAALLLFAFSLDGFDAKKLGYRWRLQPEGAEVMDFAAAQLPGTLFAAWPQGSGAMEYLPYLARRPIFVMQKAHYPTYEKHILEMRARMAALIDAYLATEKSPLRALHCDWGVDYLVVEKSHFSEAADRPAYFAPFDERIEALWQERRSTGFLLQNPDAALVVLESERYLILRLQQPCKAD